MVHLSTTARGRETSAAPTHKAETYSMKLFQHIRQLTLQSECSNVPAKRCTLGSPFQAHAFTAHVLQHVANHNFGFHDHREGRVLIPSRRDTLFNTVTHFRASCDGMGITQPA